MFNKVFIPISSEFYSKAVIERGIFIAEYFQSKVHILYIIEETPMQQMEKFSDTHLTLYNRTETHQTLLQKKKQTADNIFKEINSIYKSKNIDMTFSFIYGDFTTSAKNELKKTDYDIVLMGYDKQCMIDYRLLNEITIPIWIEGGGHHQSILAICSNLAPNQKVPELSIKLSRILNWPLTMLYVVDTQDAVQVDSNGIRSTKKPKEVLIDNQNDFVESMKLRGITVKKSRGPLENEISKQAREMAAGLVIIGREQKRKGSLGLPVKNIKQKMAERCKYSLLFLN